MSDLTDKLMLLAIYGAIGGAMLYAAMWVIHFLWRVT